MEQVLSVGIERHSRLVQTFGIVPVEVMFGYDRAHDQYTVQVKNLGEFLLIRRPSRVRVQFEDGDWHNITPGYWIAELVLGEPNGDQQVIGACAVMPTPEQCFIEAFNQNY